MGVHSQILMHWTGDGKGDIESKPKEIRPQLYLKRLIDYYQHGLFAKRTSEDAIRSKKITDVVRLCFTEIRLSQAQAHAKRYGKLGVGFTRDSIMNKGGRPVIYIPYAPEADSCLLEDSIRNVYKRSGDDAETHRSARWIMAYVKRMSNGSSEDYYEEMEWRLVYDENPNNSHFTKGKAEGVHRLGFQASDVRVIVFSDEHVKRMSLRDTTMKKYFAEHVPVMATLDDYSNV